MGDVLPEKKPLASYRCPVVFIFIGSDIFYSSPKIVDGMFCFDLLYIGPAAEAAKYRYRVEFYDVERAESLVVSCLARSWDEDLSEVHNSGNCVKLNPEQLNRFVNEWNILEFSIEIINYPNC
jgi:hypothetical protein